MSGNISEMLSPQDMEVNKGLFMYTLGFRSVNRMKEQLLRLT